MYILHNELQFESITTSTGDQISLILTDIKDHEGGAQIDRCLIFEMECNTIE